jgi:anti-anti-sigma factor
MLLIVHRTRTQVRIHLSGDLDIAVRGRLDQGLARATASTPSELILDLRRVSFCDCSCAGLMLRAVRETLAGGGRAALVVDSPIVRRVIDILEFPDSCPIRTTLEDARQAIGV